MSNSSEHFRSNTLTEPCIRLERSGDFLCQGQPLLVLQASHIGLEEYVP